MNIIITEQQFKQLIESNISTKEKNQPYDTNVEFDDAIYITRNKTSVPPLSQGAVDNAVKYNPIKEDTTQPMVFWHGGNLDDYSNDSMSQKSGRFEYGPGLYLITKYQEAIKYAKGNRKLYQVTVNHGNDLEETGIDANNVKLFVKQYILSNKRNDIWTAMSKRIGEDNKIPGFIVNNIIINYDAIKPGNTKYLRQFYINNGIDYNIVKNPFGWGETMMVLFNMNKIIEVKRIDPKDKIEKFDLHE